MKPIGCFFVLAILFSACTRNNTTSTNSGKNNLLVVKENNVIHAGKPDQIQFDGNNNLFDLVLNNAAYFDGRETVIIVQGDNNIIKLYNRNLVDMSAPGMDTLLLIGDKVKYIMDVNNTVVLKTTPSKTDTIRMQPKIISAQDFASDFKENDYRIKWLTDKLNTNEPEAYYDLANLYNYELNTKEAGLKAVELYEYAATQNHVPSIQKLGDIFANGSFELPKNLKKAQYFFTLGVNLGDPYSQERLDELRAIK